jgi:hypothetical protein
MDGEEKMTKRPTARAAPRKRGRATKRVRRSPAPAPLAPESNVPESNVPVSDPPARADLVRRLWGVAEFQVSDIEARMSAPRCVPAERERDARTLAVVSRTLRELIALDGAQAAQNKEGATEPDDDGSANDGPADIEEFRRELERRLAAIRDRRRDGADGGAAGAVE